MITIIERLENQSDAPSSLTRVDIVPSLRKIPRHIEITCDPIEEVPKKNAWQSGPPQDNRSMNASISTQSTGSLTASEITSII